MHEELEASEEARRGLKINIQELTDQKIDLEEELYQSKTSLIDMIDQLKILEEDS